MAKRILALWFRHLKTDRLARRQPDLKGVPFVLAAPERGRLTVTAASPEAEGEGIRAGTGVADARALLPGLQVRDDEPGAAAELLHELAVWCLRYTPVAAADAPDGLLLDTSGCTHLWGGEAPYVDDVVHRLRRAGYGVRAALADTVGAAWAVARYGAGVTLVPAGEQAAALRPLPPAALRLEPDAVAKLERLGLRAIGRFMDLPRAALRRRFGPALLRQLDRALGAEAEPLRPVVPEVVVSERLPSADAIGTRTGIEIALRRLLAAVCARLAATEEGLRTAVFTAYRADGAVQRLTIGTVTPSRNAEHLFRLFDLKLETLEPGPGFELFLLEAPVVEPLSPLQEMLWHTEGTGDEAAVAELLNRMAGKLGIDAVHRYLPDAHHWPERSYRIAPSLTDTAPAAWYTDRPRPVHLLARPEPIQVMVRLPDYPPVHFVYRGKVCRVARADGPERIEPEWWLEPGQHRDYYCVEDGDGARYWIFRRGHYSDGDPEWFLHGFFA